MYSVYTVQCSLHCTVLTTQCTTVRTVVEKNDVWFQENYFLIWSHLRVRDLTGAPGALDYDLNDLEFLRKILVLKGTHRKPEN